MGIILQILSVVSFSLGNVLWKLFHVKSNIFTIISKRSFITALLFLVAVLISDSWQATLFKPYLTAIALSIISFWGLYFYNLSIRILKAGQTTTVTGLTSFFGVVTSIIVYQESFNITLIFVSLLIVSGLFLIEDKFTFKWSKGTLYAIIAAFIWGTTFALFKIPVEQIGSLQFSFVLECCVFVESALIVLFSKNKSNYKLSKKELIIVALLAITTFSGVLLYNLSVT